MRTLRVLALSLMVGLATLAAAQSLTLYVGRGEAFAGPILERFTQDTGIQVEIRYGSTAELAVLLTEEGAASPADGFWAQDAGALGALEKAGLLAAVPGSLVGNVAYKNVHPSLEWVAITARNRVLAYSTERVTVDELPASILDLVNPIYKDRVAWAPGNASFQSFVTALRVSYGEDAARSWLEGMIANGARTYSNNGGQLTGVASAEVDFALVNNYYLMRSLASDPAFPVAQTFFADGDIGNLANVTGVGVLASSDAQDLMHQLIAYLLSDEAQAYFTNDQYEYPITMTATPYAGLESTSVVTAASPLVDLTSIDDLEGTLELLREVGLL